MKDLSRRNIIAGFVALLITGNALVPAALSAPRDAEMYSAAFACQSDVLAYAALTAIPLRIVSLLMQGSGMLPPQSDEKKHQKEKNDQAPSLPRVPGSGFCKIENSKSPHGFPVGLCAFPPAREAAAAGCPAGNGRRLFGLFLPAVALLLIAARPRSMLSDHPGHLFDIIPNTRSGRSRIGFFIAEGFHAVH